MSHRLRLYFGASRSNTAPELEEPDDKHIEDGTGGAMAFQMQSSQGRVLHEAQPAADASLKRSSSMFIPQLQSFPECRPTKSSSMQISLQRSNALTENALYQDSPPGYPDEPAPAYTESSPGWNAPPEYSFRVNAEHTHANTEPALPKRRVFCVRPGDIQDGYTVCSTAPPGISIGGFCIKRNSSEGSEVQQLRILPFGSDGQSSPCRWSVKQNLDGASGPQRLVFQLQQDQPRQPDVQKEAFNFGFVGSKGGRVVRYPRIRLERSASQPLKSHAVPRRTGSTPDLLSITSQMDTQSEDAYEDGAQSCTFKIRKEQKPRQPQFKIYFSQGADQGPVSAQDASLRNGPVRMRPQVC